MYYSKELVGREFDIAFIPWEKCWDSPLGIEACVSHLEDTGCMPVFHCFMRSAAFLKHSVEPGVAPVFNEVISFCKLSDVASIPWMV